MAGDLCHADKKAGLRRNVEFSFFHDPQSGTWRDTNKMRLDATIASYELAHTMVQQLQECPYRCQISALSIEPLTKRGSRSDAPPPLTSGEVPASLRGTFFDFKKN